MRVKNYTNIPDERVRQIINSTRPNHLPTSNFDVKITNSSKRYSGVFYEEGGYAKKGIGSDPNRPLVVVRVTPDENRFPHFADYRPTRRIELHYEKHSEDKAMWEEWYSRKHVGISKAYIERRNRENKERGKHYDWTKSTGGYINHMLLSREEALVHILAHELRHLWQKNHPRKRGRVWGARGQYSDRDADAYAIRKTRNGEGHVPLTSIPNIQTSKDKMEMTDCHKWSFLLENDSKEFGLTFDEYHLLLEDIQLGT